MFGSVPKDSGFPTIAICSRDQAWRSLLRTQVEGLGAIVIGESDDRGDIGPSAVRFEDNRWGGPSSPAIVLRIGVDPNAAADLEWPLSDNVIRVALRSVAASLRERGLLLTSDVAEQAFRRLVNLSPDSIEVVDERVRLLYVNPAFEQITGYNLAEVLGRTTGDLFRAGTHDPSFYQNILSTLNQGKIWRGQLVARRRDNALSYQESVLAPFWAADGKRLGYVALKRDLARDELLDRAAGNQDAQRAALFREVADAFLLHDEEGHLLDRNDRAVRMFRLDEQVNNQAPSLLDRFAPDDAKRLVDNWRGLEESVPVIIDATILDAGVGPRRTVSFSSVRARVAGEDLVLSVARDITSRVELEQKARDLADANSRIQGLTQTLREERQQEQANRFDSLSVLAGSLSHDLNNSLSVIMGNLYALSMTNDADDRDEILEDINDGMRSAQDISRRFTSFSRGSAAVLTPMHIQPWLQELTRSFRASNNVQVDYIAPEEAVWCLADEQQLNQLILNLLINALQAAGNEAPITVELEAVETEAGPVSVIRVADRGGGIPDELRARLFEPFVTTKPAGSGLGLASALRIVQGHNGQIDVSNRAGGGACFKVTLQRQITGKATLTVGKRESLEDGLGPSVLEDCTVLVLDDEPRVLHAIGRILRGHGAKTLLFSTGEAIVEAQDQMLTGPKIPGPEIVFVLDLLIVGGGIDGLETMRRLRKRDPLVRAIACSGYNPNANDQDYETIGFGAHLKKPFLAENLIRTILRMSTKS